MVSIHVTSLTLTADKTRVKEGEGVSFLVRAKLDRPTDGRYEYSVKIYVNGRFFKETPPILTPLGVTEIQIPFTLTFCDGGYKHVKVASPVDIVVRPTEYIESNEVTIYVEPKPHPNIKVVSVDVPSTVEQTKTISVKYGKIYVLRVTVRNDGADCYSAGEQAFIGIKMVKAPPDSQMEIEWDPEKRDPDPNFRTWIPIRPDGKLHQIWWGKLHGGESATVGKYFWFHLLRSQPGDYVLQICVGYWWGGHSYRPVITDTKTVTIHVAGSPRPHFKLISLNIPTSFPSPNVKKHWSITMMNDGKGKGVLAVFFSQKRLIGLGAYPVIVYQGKEYPIPLYPDAFYILVKDVEPNKQVTISGDIYFTKPGKYTLIISGEHLVDHFRVKDVIKEVTISVGGEEVTPPTKPKPTVPAIGKTIVQVAPLVAGSAFLTLTSLKRR